MRKIIVSALAVLMSFQSTVSAFELKGASPDNSMLVGRDLDIESDKQYLKSVADKYSPLYVVEEKEYIDISDIDRFYSELSKPLTLEELDKGKTDINLDIAPDSNLKNNLNRFKVLAGLAGYKAEFEPIMYFNIYRDISLVGGYSYYTKTYENTDDASWAYITGVEALTKEILLYNTRLSICESIKELDNYINSDNRFKIFLLKGGKIDSVWEREDI